MTTKITVECDGTACPNKLTIPSDNDEYIEEAGWEVCDYGMSHYCPECLPVEATNN